MAFLLDRHDSAFTLLILTLAVALYILYFTKKSKYPPGPSRSPLIGNLLDVPRPGTEWLDYHQMCKKYDSDMLYLEVLGKPMLILDSIEVITELLDKRSNIYSSRPPTTMVRDPRLMDWGGNFILMPYGSPWRERRRLFHSELSARSVTWHHPQQTRGAHGLLSRLLDSPELWRAHLQQQIGAAILDVAYGIQAVDEDPLIKLVEEVNILFLDATLPGRYLVEILPWLKYVPAWVPGASFRHKAAEAKAHLKDMSSIPFQTVKRAIVEGTANPSFVTNCLQNIDTTGDVKHQEMLIEDSAGVMFFAGADTTFSVIATFILAMIKYPQVQAKAQHELDAVLGPGQLPSFGDEDSLPYITAIVKECLRWEVVAPLAVPHLTTEDDEYKGFHIPAGTIVLANSWAVLNDERMYPNPLTFNPGRFIKDGKLDPSVRDPEVAFGYGRRVCPGQHMARGTIWINIACLLASFNIQKPVDAQGKEFEPSVQYGGKLARHPEPFTCMIKPRSSDVADMIRGLSV